MEEVKFLSCDCLPCCSILKIYPHDKEYNSVLMEIYFNGSYPSRFSLIKFFWQVVVLKRKYLLHSLYINYHQWQNFIKQSYLEEVKNE
jgi:hypothetical protein